MERRTYAINFWVSPSKARKNGKAPINITITLNGQRASLSSNKMIAPNDWDTTRQRVKGTNETAKLINESLLQIKNKIYKKECEDCRKEMEKMRAKIILPKRKKSIRQKKNCFRN